MVAGCSAHHRHMLWQIGETVDEDGHHQVLGGEDGPQGMAGLVEKDHGGSRTNVIRSDVPAAGAFDVVGVHRAAANRRDRLFELAALVEPVCVKAELNVVSLAEIERRVDDLRVGREVLMDFEPGAPHLEDEALVCSGVVRARGRLQADVDRQLFERFHGAAPAPDRLLQPAVIRVVMPPS